jgi:hypothetical protein
MSYALSKLSIMAVGEQRLKDCFVNQVALVDACGRTT